jgi:hypothetical protein
VTDLPGIQGPLAAGHVLPEVEVDLTRTGIVAMSLATRDFHPVHHDVETARVLGHPDLFINIMTTSGLVERFIRTWCGQHGRLSSLKLKLGIAHYANERLVFSGKVEATGRLEDGSQWAEVSFVGVNLRGRHAGGSVRVQWPRVFPGAEAAIPVPTSNLQ